MTERLDSADEMMGHQQNSTTDVRHTQSVYPVTCVVRRAQQCGVELVGAMSLLTAAASKTSLTKRQQRPRRHDLAQLLCMCWASCSSSGDNTHRC